MIFNIWMLSKEKKSDRINYEINAQMRVVTFVLQIIFLQNNVLSWTRSNSSEAGICKSKINWKIIQEI